MADGQNDGSKKKSDAKIFIIAAALLVFLGVAYFISLGPLPEAPEVEITEEADVSEVEQAFSDDGEEVGAEEAQSADTGAVVAGETVAAFDLELAKRERILGDATAPIKISEHSSFSCPRCANFHAGPFKDLKANYIDSGRAYLVYVDFPTNQQALHASMVARCVPEDRYFEFVEHLFATQPEWLPGPTYITKLKEKAAGFGLSGEVFDACIQSQELEDSIIKRIEAVQQQWQLSQTPSLVINNQTVVGDAQLYDPDAKKAYGYLQSRIESTLSGGQPSEATEGSTETE